MSNFLVEIERCIRLGIAFDLFWDLENLSMDDYREIVTVREDGKVNVFKDGKSTLYESARTPERPEGIPPQLSVEVLKAGNTVPYTVTARAKVIEGSAPVFYTKGADKNGVHNNQYVLWELYGPEEEDYADLLAETWSVSVYEKDNHTEVEMKFTIDRPGNYRLRAATSDVAGRSTVVYENIYC
jgi:hypothetical protein